MSDIVGAIAKISHLFRAINLEPPAVILLKDHDQGMRLLAMLNQMIHTTVPIQGGGSRVIIQKGGGRVIKHPDRSVWMEAEVHGMKVRWPAIKFAKEGGGYVWF